MIHKGRNPNSLLPLARKVVKNAYSPYSKVKVGAVLVSDNGKTFTGCNVENSSYGLAICAERNAVFKAVSEGINKFDLIMIASNQTDFILPCGACLQVLEEFSPTMKIMASNRKGDIREYDLKELLPSPFRLVRLK